MMPEGKLNSKVVGMPASVIAEMAGINVDSKTKILIAKLEGVGPEYPLSREKLSPVLAYYVVDGYEEGFDVCKKILDFGGLGHSAIIHSTNEEVIKKFGEAMKVGRIIVNSPFFNTTDSERCAHTSAPASLSCLYTGSFTSSASFKIFTSTDKILLLSELLMRFQELMR